MINRVQYGENDTLSQKIAAARTEASEYAHSEKKTIYAVAVEDCIEYTDDLRYAVDKFEKYNSFLMAFNASGGEEDTVGTVKRIKEWKESGDIHEQP